MVVRIVAADDHPVVLDGLEHLLEAHADLELAGRCTTGGEAVRLARELDPDLLVLDVRMPGNEGLAVLRTLRAEGSPVRVVLLTVELDDATLVEAADLGVRGVLLKETPPARLLECLRAVAAGRRWIDDARVEAARARRLASPGAASLTVRELDIVRLVAAGLRSRDIAARLGIKEGTVKNHLHTVYEKLGADNRTSLLARARTAGLV